MKTKAALLTFFILFISWSLFGQDFYVLHVKGIVKKANTDVMVKTKDVIKPDDQLIFSSPTDAVAVVSPKSGRFILKPGKSAKKNELMSYVKDALTPASTRLSTRSGGLNNMLDLKAFFQRPLLLLPELKYPVSAQSFPINEKTFFFIQFQYHGEEINKQLKINDSSLLIINREDLFKVDGKQISETEAKDFTLHYYSSFEPIAVSLLSFNLTNLIVVRSEVDVLVEALEQTEKNPAKIEREILDYLSEHYGQVDADNLKRWLKQP